MCTSKYVFHLETPPQQVDHEYCCLHLSRLITSILTTASPGWCWVFNVPLDDHHSTRHHSQGETHHLLHPSNTHHQSTCILITLRDNLCGVTINLRTILHEVTHLVTVKAFRLWLVTTLSPVTSTFPFLPSSVTPVNLIILSSVLGFSFIHKHTHKSQMVALLPLRKSLDLQQQLLETNEPSIYVLFSVSGTSPGYDVSKRKKKAGSGLGLGLGFQISFSLVVEPWLL